MGAEFVGGTGVGGDVIFVTTCTNRKRQTPSNRLRAASLPSGRLVEVVREWCRRVQSAESAAPALELYSGRSFSEARIIWRTLKTTPLIISAGLGLVVGSQKVPAYSLTLSPRSPDSIAVRVTDSGFQPSWWWSALTDQLDGANSIATFVRRRPGALFVIALSEPYAALIEDDLGSLNSRDLARVRLVGLRRPDVLPESLRVCWMPYDDRLDGSKSPIPGTRGDFPQRASRHFVECVLSTEPRSPVERHSELVRSALDGLPPAGTYARTSKSDAEIVRLIADNWDRTDGRSGRLLRILRDELQVACEQSRFKRLFREAAAVVAG